MGAKTFSHKLRVGLSQHGDIKPKGFRVIEFDGFLTDQTVWLTQRILEDPNLVQEMAENNYKLARRYYSYAVLERRLQTLLMECFGEDRC